MTKHPPLTRHCKNCGKEIVKRDNETNREHHFRVYCTECAPVMKHMRMQRVLNLKKGHNYKIKIFTN